MVRWYTTSGVYLDCGRSGHGMLLCEALWWTSDLCIMNITCVQLKYLSR